MAKVLCIDDFAMYSEMVAISLERKGGHHTAVAIVPFDLNNLRDFNPDVIVINLVRKVEALGVVLHDFYTQVDGARALRTIAQASTREQFPLVITSIAVQEAELPKGFSYVAFVEIPAKLDSLLGIIDRIVKAKGQEVVPE